MAPAGAWFQIAPVVPVWSPTMARPLDPPGTLVYGVIPQAGPVIDEQQVGDEGLVLIEKIDREKVVGEDAEGRLPQRRTPSRS